MNAPMKPAKSFIRLIVCLVFLCGGQWVLAQTNFWEQTNGPYGGIVYALAINSSGHIFAGTGSGIPEEQFNQIFNLYYTTKPNGTGMS